MRRRRRKPPPQIPSRVQETSHIGRGWTNTGAVSPQQQAAAVASQLEVYDSVEAANRAGLPMPGQF